MLRPEQRSVTWSTTINTVSEAFIEFGLDANYGMTAPVDLSEPRSFATPITHDSTAVSGNVMAYPAGGFNSCVVITEITPDATTTPIYDATQVWAGRRCHANAIRPRGSTRRLLYYEAFTNQMSGLQRL